MSAKKTKQAFTNICDRICTKILGKEKLDFQTEGELYRIVARLSMISWNECTVSDSLEEAKYKAADFACPLYGDDEKQRPFCLAPHQLNGMITGKTIRSLQAPALKSSMGNTKLSHISGESFLQRHLKPQMHSVVIWNHRKSRNV